MEEIYAKALKEVYTILENSEKSIQEKITEKFKIFIIYNMDKEYNPNIDFDNPDWEDTIMEETQQILAVIYRDYLVTPEEREKLILEENEEEKRIEEELREKYNPDNLFKKNKYEQEISNVSETALIKVEDNKWYKKFINKMISLIKNKIIK